MVRELFTGPEKLRICARGIRRRAMEKQLAEKVPNAKLKWTQVDMRDELARLIGAASDQKVADAPQEWEE